MLRIPHSVDYTPIKDVENEKDLYPKNPTPKTQNLKNNE